MKRIPIEIVIGVEGEAPDIVDEVLKSAKPTVVLTLEDFDGQPLLFFNCVWYAISHGKQVVVRASH